MTRDGQSVPLNLNHFFATHAVFTVDDVQRYMVEHGSSNPNTRKALLTYHRTRGRIVSIRRGLYATVPPGHDPATYAVDPVLIAAKLTDDSVVAYHSALEFHARAYTTHSHITYASGSRSPVARFRGMEYLRVPQPTGLKSSGQTMFGVDSHHRDGVTVRVTTLERTLVDVLDRPELSGSWEEIWRSLEMIEFFDLDLIVRYVELLGNATTAAKVGFYLSQHRDELMVDEAALAILKSMIPRQPHYMDRGARTGGRLVSEWNLLVPPEILGRLWEEML